MQNFQPVLLKVWREACRDIEIQCVTAEIGPMLRAEMPVGRILVRRIDPERRCLEAVAEETLQQDRRPAETRIHLTESQFAGLLDWCRSDQVRRFTRDASPSGDDRDLDFLLPRGVSGEVLAGPLCRGGRPCGVLLLVSHVVEGFSARDEQLANVLLEPFGVALENDRRIRELSTLREAAEADRRSLLSRLGRERLGDTIVGASHGLAAVMQRVELVARSDAPVLIFGETGTGKELIARAIHDRSPRAAGPILRVNCGAIAPELIDTELFGHERGAFTGAEQQRKGWFERADGGTLFLDEVGDLPSAAQVRLLRILQDGWLERVGGQQPVHVDVRIVAATHRDLARMVAEGRFREDLWYRLAVFPIVLPPLRERQADIPELARHFVHRAAIRFGLPEAPLKDGDFRLLQSYDWPGNVRELAAVIDRAAILGDGASLEVAAALGHAVETPTASRPARDAIEAMHHDEAPGIEPLETAVRRHIEQALTATLGRVEGPHGAARLLKINPNTLRSKMRKLGVDPRRFRQQVS